jgi:DNA-binding CsgD family transcriptional regulator
MYWDKILKEVLNKKLVNARKIGKIKYGVMEKRCNRSYPLGPKFGDKYFTRREAECMVLLLSGKTIAKTAMALGLSPRTIEFYLKRMKLKLGCQTKFELIEIIWGSKFLQAVDFI